MTNEALKAAEKNEVLITRIINAPRQLVYDCWTQAEHLKRWYAPNNCTCIFTKIDIKPGSGYHGAIVHNGDGRKNWFYAVFKEIDPPKKLVFTLARADEHGNHLSPKDAGMPAEWPEITVVTLTFEDLGKQTRFTLHQTVDLDLATRHGAYPSWLQMLDRMETLLLGRAAIAQQDSTSGYAQIGELKMYYEIHGEGFPLVLIHGGGSTIGTSFGNVLHAFAERHRVIAVELQAHGHTRDIDRPLSFHQDADDIAALLQLLHIEQADIFGFSNGGQTAMDIAIRHPQLVHKLVIGSAFFKRSGAYDWFWPGFDHASLDQMPEYLRDAYLTINPDSAGLKAMFHRDVTRMKNFQDWPDEEIKNVQTPTLLIIGDQDLVRPEYAVGLTRLMPHARLIILPGHHGEYLESKGYLSQCTANMVNDFLSTQPSTF